METWQRPPSIVPRVLNDSVVGWIVGEEDVHGDVEEENDAARNHEEEE